MTRKLLATVINMIIIKISRTVEPLTLGTGMFLFFVMFFDVSIEVTKTGKDPFAEGTLGRLLLIKISFFPFTLFWHVQDAKTKGLS